MKIGTFDINSYLDKLNESLEESNESKPENKDGIIIPKENLKIFTWLKKEYQKNAQEVKIEVTGKGSSFVPDHSIEANDKIEGAKLGNANFEKSDKSNISSKAPKIDKIEDSDKKDDEKEEETDNKSPDSKTKDTTNNINKNIKKIDLKVKDTK